LRSLAADLLLGVDTSDDMTEKNFRKLEQFDDGKKFALLIALPQAVMSKLEEKRRSNPLRLADVRRARAAAAVALLNATVIRRRTLVSLELDRNFRLPGERDCDATLTVYPDQEKTRKTLQMIVPASDWRVVTLYWNHYRPKLPGAAGSKFLFPAISGHMCPDNLATQVTKLVREFGLGMNLHLWRHLMSTKLEEEDSGVDGGAVIGHKPGSRSTGRYVRTRGKIASKRLHKLTEPERERGLKMMARGKGRRL
jgi:hypothetical protein